MTHDVTKVALALQTTKAQLKALDEQHAADTADMREDLKLLEQAFAEAAHAAAVTSVTTKLGIVGLQTRTVYKCFDPVLLQDFITQYGETEVAKLTLHTEGLKEYVKRTEGLIPPGVQQVEIESIYNRPKKG